VPTAWQGVSLLQATATDSNGSTIALNAVPQVRGAEGDKQLAYVFVVPAAIAQQPAMIREMFDHLTSAGTLILKTGTGKEFTADISLLPTTGT
jgi:hypothetical protein